MKFVRAFLKLQGVSFLCAVLGAAYSNFQLMALFRNQDWVVTAVPLIIAYIVFAICTLGLTIWFLQRWYVVFVPLCFFIYYMVLLMTWNPFSLPRAPDDFGEGLLLAFSNFIEVGITVVAVIVTLIWKLIRRKYISR